MKETQGALLPKFTAEESKLLRATTIDFFSVNFYCGYYVWAPAPGSPKELVSYITCYFLSFFVDFFSVNFYCGYYV